MTFRSTPEYTLNPNLQIKSLSIGNEQETILIIDNFLNNHEHLINNAKTKVFTPYETLYPGIKSNAPKEYSDELFRFVIPLIKAHYSLPPLEKIHIAKCLFSLITTDQQNLSIFQRAPHRDSSYEYQFAILLYLCESSHGGTSFYRHNITEFETITRTRSTYYNFTYDEDIKINGEPDKRYQNGSDRRYTEIGHVAAKPNRLLVYRSCLLHSPTFNPDFSVSADPENGRLTLNSFLVFS